MRGDLVFMGTPLMRVALVRVSAFWLELVFRGHDYSRITTDWPADAQITNATWDQNRSLITLTVQSARFGEVPAGNNIPEWSPTVTTHMDETAQLIELTRRNRAADLDTGE